jgi:curved DNA-binding protein CbpA
MKYFINFVTIDDVKQLYRKLAKKFHPDLGGSKEAMQEINAEYKFAMQKAIKGEPDQHRRDQAEQGFEPLREAIEFAITLPEDISVTVRGFWLWLEGNTYAEKERIKSFKSESEIKFRWSKNKQSWYFAAVPSANRSKRRYTFDEIEEMHGRQVINKQRRQRDKIAA